MRNLRTNLLIFIYHEIMEKTFDFFQEKIMANLHQRIAFDSLFMSLSLH